MIRYDVLHKNGELAGKVWQRGPDWFASHMTPPAPDRGPYGSRKSAKAYLLTRPPVPSVHALEPVITRLVPAGEEAPPVATVTGDTVDYIPTTGNSAARGNETD